jgi:enoyl-CoA hydratase
MLICEEDNQIAIITLNRPDKHNALSRELRDEIINCLNSLEDNKNINVVVLTGSGNSFCAGFDLSEFKTGNIEEIFEHSANYHHKVYNFSKPIIAAVNGSSMAGGMDLAAMCDIRIISSDSHFGQPQVKMGIPAAFDLISTILPETLARELCLTGRLMDAEEALSCGFANEISKPKELLRRAKELAQEISENKNVENMKAKFKKLQPNLF